jgi:hypothetical protein
MKRTQPSPILTRIDCSLVPTEILVLRGAFGFRRELHAYPLHGNSFTIGKIAPKLVFIKLGSYEHKSVILTAKAESPISWQPLNLRATRVRGIRRIKRMSWYCPQCGTAFSEYGFSGYASRQHEPVSFLFRRILSITSIVEDHDQNKKQQAGIISE